MMKNDEVSLATNSRKSIQEGALILLKRKHNLPKKNPVNNAPTPSTLLLPQNKCMTVAEKQFNLEHSFYKHTVVSKENKDLSKQSVENHSVDRSSSCETNIYNNLVDFAQDFQKKQLNDKKLPISLRKYSKEVVKWSCIECSRECIPVREESRCLCGHRLKEHPSEKSNVRVRNPDGFKAFACVSCKCSRFFYIVAEGAWILRCRCKHKHIDHNPAKSPYSCNIKTCNCSGFDSPWVCNCNHPWANHKQEFIKKEFNPLKFAVEFGAEELCQVHRTDLKENPLLL